MLSESASTAAYSTSRALARASVTPSLVDVQAQRQGAPSLDSSSSRSSSFFDHLCRTSTVGVSATTNVAAADENATSRRASRGVRVAPSAARSGPTPAAPSRRHSTSAPYAANARRCTTILATPPAPSTATKVASPSPTNRMHAAGAAHASSTAFNNPPLMTSQTRTTPLAWPTAAKSDARARSTAATPSSQAVPNTRRTSWKWSKTNVRPRDVPTATNFAWTANAAGSPGPCAA
mmetsp:Transcript_19330/g.59492  ORF Transcript_19330/g.59492 Transcript_19330/m.59492 type:complete len:235 (-) Transcript_19330:48-752(-)